MLLHILPRNFVIDPSRSSCAFCRGFVGFICEKLGFQKLEENLNFIVIFRKILRANRVDDENVLFNFIVEGEGGIIGFH